MAEKQDPLDAPAPHDALSHTPIRPQHRKPHDPDVTFEEYHYYARRTRDEERSFPVPKTSWKEIVLRKKNTDDVAHADHAGSEVAQHSNHLEISDDEWTNASRAFRTASWGACKRAYARAIRDTVVLTGAERFLLDHYGHPRAIWSRVRDGNFGLGTR